MPAKAKQWQPTEVERRQFGALADDIACLRRRCGLTVARYRDDFRIGTNADLDVVTAAALAARARREREARR